MTTSENEQYEVMSRRGSGINSYRIYLCTVRIVEDVNSIKAFLFVYSIFFTFISIENTLSI